MVSFVHSTGLKLVSVPYWRRVGLFPMLAILALAWIFVLIWLVVAVWVFSYNVFWSVTLSASTLAFGSFLGFMTYKIFAGIYCDYVLELTDDEAVLSVTDRLRHKRSVQMVLLDDIKFAEYYPFQDSALIIFHTNYADMEVPLWPMGETGCDVADFLKGRGVHVIDVQSDEKFPD